jgi:hypothetical protein
MAVSAVERLARRRTARAAVKSLNLMVISLIKDEVCERYVLEI